MPLLYGEGDRAFLRLQEEILRVTGDLSILAWDCKRNEHTDNIEGRLLAPSARFFSGSNDIMPCPGLRPRGRYELSTFGLRVTLPVLVLATQYEPTLPYWPTHGAVLGFRRGGALLVLLMCPNIATPGDSRFDVTTSTNTIPIEQTRLHLIGFEKLVDSIPREILIATKRTRRFFDFEIPGLLLGTWLRVSHADYIEGLQLSEPTPPHHFDILHLDADENIDLHAHIVDNSWGTNGMRLTYRGCVYQMQINPQIRRYYPSDKLLDHQGLEITHVPPCGRHDVDQQDHEGMQWTIGMMWEVIQSGKYRQAPGTLAGHLTLAPGTQLRVALSHETITNTRSGGNVLIELRLDHDLMLEDTVEPSILQGESDTCECVWDMDDSVSSMDEYVSDTDQDESGIEWPMAPEPRECGPSPSLDPIIPPRSSFRAEVGLVPHRHPLAKRAMSADELIETGTSVSVSSHPGSGRTLATHQQLRRSRRTKRARNAQAKPR